MDTNLNILLVEDDLFTQKTTERILSKFGTVEAVSTAEEATALLASKRYDIAFFDLNLKGKLEGLNLVKRSWETRTYPIVVSGEADKDVIQKSLKNGAKDYLIKPFDDVKLNSVLSRFQVSRKEREILSIIRKTFITKNQNQIKELSKIINLSVSNKPIFIDGETGTGKRVVAHLIKDTLGCKNFIEVNCSQFTGDTVRSELFGHKAGSFTGATGDKIGLLQKADNGILFLDEIHCLSLDVQKLLLKAIEEKIFYPVGSNTPVKSEFRIVTATCEDINQLISQGLFREDLFARISTFQIKLLPLRERSEDIIPIFEYLISKHPFQIVLEKESEEILKKYAWPRNTREIQDLIENWIVNGHRLISPDILPQRIKLNLPNSKKIFTQMQLDLIEERGLKDFISEFKKEVALEFLKRNGESTTKAAKSMKIGLSTIKDILNGSKV